MQKVLFFGLLCASVFLGGCGQATKNPSSFFQTNAATLLNDYGADTLKNLTLLRTKLEARNPSYSDPTFKRKLDAILALQGQGYVLKNYKEYIKRAFDPQNKYRNDDLLLAIFSILHEGYGWEKDHRFSALEYDGKKLVESHKILQVIAWKLKSAQDKSGRYLFYTWQNESGMANCSFEGIFATMEYQMEKSIRLVGEEPETLSVKGLSSLFYLLIL